MTKALVVDSAITELNGSPFEAGGHQYAGNVISLWTDEQLAEIGVYPITDDAIPDGKIAAGSTLEHSGNQVFRHWTLEDAPPPGVPTAVTPVQGRLALLAANLLDQVETAVQGADRATQLWYEYATVWERDNSIINALGTTLGLSGPQMDQLFTQAAAIK